MNNFLSIDDYPRFKEAYEKAVKEDKQLFVFDNIDILTTYAKYMCEYFEIMIKSGRHK